MTKYPCYISTTSCVRNHRIMFYVAYLNVFQYHITQSTALGRLSHIFRKAKDSPEADCPITLFSGDAFSPSLESAVMKGEHMVPILNHLLIDVACYENHGSSQHHCMLKRSSLCQKTLTLARTSLSSFLRTVLFRGCWRMRYTLMDACWLPPKSISCSKRRATGLVSLVSQERSSNRLFVFGSFTHVIISAAIGHQIVSAFQQIASSSIQCLWQNARLMHSALHTALISSSR